MTHIGRRRLFRLMMIGGTAAIIWAMISTYREVRQPESRVEWIPEENSRVLLRVSNEALLWRVGGLYEETEDRTDGRLLRSPLVHGLDVDAPYRYHGLATLEQIPHAPPRQYELFTNAKGFRSREFEWRKPPGTFRIVVMGDSTAFGYPVDADEAYSAVLERELRRALPPERRESVEVLNLGIPGWTMAEAAMLWRGLDQLEADLVVAGTGFNDRGYCDENVKPIPAEEIPHPWHEWQLPPLDPDGPPPEVPDPEMVEQAVGRFGPKGCPTSRTPERFEQMLEQYIMDVRARGADFALVYAEFFRRDYERAYAEVAEKYGVPIYWAAKRLADEEVRASDDDPECPFEPQPPPEGARTVRLRVRMRSAETFKPDGYRLFAQPLGDDVYKVYVQAPWFAEPIEMEKAAVGEELYATTVRVPVGETVKFYFEPGRAGWRERLFGHRPRDPHTHLSARLWLTMPGELARYHRRCDPPDLYTTPIYTYGSFRYFVEMIHPNEAGHQLIGEELAPLIQGLPRWRRWVGGSSASGAAR